MSHFSLLFNTLPQAEHSPPLLPTFLSLITLHITGFTVAGPGPASTAARGAQRDAPYSTTASRNRLDTAQMATTSHTFVAAAAPPSAPAAGRTPAPDDDAPAAAAASAASAPSTSDTLSVAVAERDGSPWSRTTISSLCRGPSASSSARAVLTSPLYSPTRNGPLPRGSHSS
uniref:Uncharacterized protein n=1 Tax=Anas platyrhynchos TaxID=8839 RepID=A0A8B9TBQ0_ANAPL